MEQTVTLKQHRFYHYFLEISNIPRGSGDEKRISDYLVAFGKGLGLDTRQDEALNVIIRKPATAGFEAAEPVILQAHMDMVCEKDPDSPHDFTRDPIQVVEKDGYLTATGTTLGADNGLGMAYMLAVLEADDLSHPAIEAVFTANEEVGMDGIIALDASVLQGTRMLNLDSDEEGSLCAGCAGGIRINLDLPVTFSPLESKGAAYIIQIQGLVGGHSGVDIDRGRANAIQLLGRTLDRLSRQCPLRVISVSGGSKMNSIPRGASATVWIADEHRPHLQQEVDYLQDLFRKEFCVKDPDITMTVAPAGGVPNQALDLLSFGKAVAVMLLAPNGAFSYNQYMDGVLDSSCNLGVVETREDHISFCSLARSNTNSKIEELASRMQFLGKILPADVELLSGYPAWEFHANSPVQQVCSSVYRRLYGSDPLVTSVHGGLECALMAEKRPDLDMISFGANLLDAHSTTERVEIASALRIWDYLVQVLKELK